MHNLSKSELIERIKTLEYFLEKQKKISSALLKRVKKNLKYQLNTNETFEHNNLLLEQIKQTKVKLLEEAQSSQKFAFYSKHDSLTGLYNRFEFNRTLKSAVKSAKKGNTHAILFLDLDQFKVINDTAGHLAGDEMLKQIATVLLTHVNSSEILSRLGGDEFGIIKLNCTLAQVVSKTNEILKLIDEFHFSWDNKLFTVSASIGIVIIDKYTISHVEAQKNADIACYAAKNSGRNRWHLYQPRDDYLLQHNAELQWVPKLIKAIDEDLFQLYAQIIKPNDVESKIVHYEILIRLPDKDRVIPPSVFLPAAERYNLIVKIDFWVITKVFQWLTQHFDKFHPQTIFSINLSGQSLGDVVILNHICHLLDKSKLGKNINFEVTETMAISNLQAANKFIKKIKEYGCGFSLDDFGSGLSSLSYLKNLEVDTLKVDGIFIRDIIDDPIDTEMVRSINNIGHVMGMKTVAEYVETKEIYEKLVEMGFDYLQGFYIGKPQPLNNLLEEF